MQKLMQTFPKLFVARFTVLNWLILMITYCEVQFPMTSLSEGEQA